MLLARKFLAIYHDGQQFVNENRSRITAFYASDIDD